MKTIFTLLLILGLYGKVAAQQPVPYQDLQASTSFQPLVSEGNKDFTLWYIIGAFATAISFLATMYVRTHGQLIAEKDKSLQREIDRSREERQFDTSYEGHVKELLSRQQMQMDSLSKYIESMAENLTQIRIDIHQITRNQ